MTDATLRELEEEYGVEIDSNFVTDTGCSCEACDEELESSVREHLAGQQMFKQTKLAFNFATNTAAGITLGILFSIGFICGDTARENVVSFWGAIIGGVL